MLKLNLISILLFTTFSHAIEITQSFNLKKGWNAIYLQVEPQIENQDISSFIFKDIDVEDFPIEIITTFSPIISSIEYIKSTDEPSWKKAGWNSWIRDDLDEAFLTNLYGLRASKAYLVKSDRDYVWQLRGELVYSQKEWEPDSFNFIGFNVAEDGISFYNYLQNSKSATAIKDGPIYTLENGVWQEVSLVDTAVEKNRAYWVFSRGSCDFQGVVEISITKGLNSIDFLDIADTKSLTIKNSSSKEATILITLEDSNIPLALVEKDENLRVSYKSITKVIKSFTLAPYGSKEITLAIERAKIDDNTKKEGILKIAIMETNEVINLAVSRYGVNR